MEKEHNLENMQKEYKCSKHGNITNDISINYSKNIIQCNTCYEKVGEIILN